MERHRLGGIAGLLTFLASCTGGEAEQNFVGSTENYIGESMAAEGGAPQDLVECEVVEKQIPRADCQALSQAAEITYGSAAFNVPDPMQQGEKTPVELIVDRRMPFVIRQLDMAAEDVQNQAGSEDLLNQAGSGNTVVPSEQKTCPDGAIVLETQPCPATTGNPPADVDPAPTPKQQADKMPGTTETFDLPVGRRMRADLLGQGFNVARVSPAVQEIARDSQGTWTWEVTAQQGGPKTLTLTTVVEAEVNGRVYELKQTKRKRTVQVGVPIKTQVLKVLEETPVWLKLLTGIITALTALVAAWLVLRKTLQGRGGAGGGTPGGQG